MTITEAAKTVQCSRQTICNYLEQGWIQAQHYGVSYEIELEDLMDVFAMSSKTSSESNKTSNVDKDINALIEQLDKKDEQIQEVHQILAMTQKSVNQLTEQNQLLLENIP